MKILHILTMHQPAGLENRAFRFICEAKQKRHAVLVVSKRIHKKFKKTLPEGVRVKHWKYLGFFKIPSLLRAYSLKRWLKKKRFDVFISYSQLSYPALWETLFENSFANSIYYEGGAAWFKPERVRSLLEKFKYYIANSSAGAVMLEKKFGLKKDKIRVIHNGLDEETFTRIKKTLPTIREKEKFIIVYLGRLVAVKGVNSIIRSLKHLGPEYELWIVGDGRERRRLERVAASEGVIERVFFKGFQVDPAPFLKAADIVVVPSLREPMPNVVLEAGAASRAVIASAVDGIPDIIDTAHNGILIKPSVEMDKMNDFDKGQIHRKVVDPLNGEVVEPCYLDPQELAAAIRNLKEDSGLRKRLGENLFRTVSQRFLMKDKIEEFDKYIEGEL